ncbi:MAG: S9 family peptidase [Bacteroidales bacterium]|nr:S9 family peptidase [Bacteroidales bacterium]
MRLINRWIITLMVISSVFQVNADGVLTPETMWKLGRVSDVQVSPDGNQIIYGITQYNVEQNKGNRDLYLLSTMGGDAIQLTDFSGSEFNGTWRPDGKKIGFLSAKSGSVQMWEMNPDGSEKMQITNIEGGVNGFKYAPTSNRILFIKDVKLDQTANDIHTDLPKANARIINDLMYRHWDSWHDYKYSHIFTAEYTNGMVGELIDIMKDERFDSPMNPWGGMEQINWSPDGEKIAYACKKLSGKDYAVSTNSEIYLYELGTKKTSTLSVKGFDGYDHDPVFSPNGEMLVWKSMKTPGFEADKERIILYNFESGQTKDMSENFDQGSSHFVWGPKSKKLYFISGTKATYQLYELNIKKGDIRQITTGKHNYTEFALAGKKLIGSKMSMSLPNEIFSISMDGKETQLSFTNKKILDNLTLGDVEERWVETTDGKQMLVWVIYPPNFDENKKYPAILYCQGGPQSAVSQFFSYRWNFQAMAANGYIIVAPNRRGLPTFGQEWCDQISQDYGGQNMKDYLTAIDTLAKEPFIDQDRLGAVGASYGGFSVYWLAGNHNKRFKTFISHCGMFNLESFFASTEETWFPTFDIGGAYWNKERPKSYDYSPHRFVQNWDTPIMVIVGEHDYRIPYTESLQAFNAAQLRNIPSRLLFLPEETHFVVRPQNSILWHREFYKWLDQWLK